MSNALFLLDNAADYAFMAASTESPTAPAANLQDIQRSKFWRSLFGTTSYVDFTLLTTAAVTHVAFVDVNLSKYGTISVEAWTDALGGATKVVDITQAPNLFTDPALPDSLYYGTYGPGPYGVIDYNAVNGRNVTIITLPSSSNALYWRVTFTDANTAYQQCTRVYIAAGKTLLRNIAYGWSARYIDNSVFKFSVGKQRFVQPRDNQLELSGNFDFLSDTERDQFIVDLRRFGESRPMIFSVFPETSTKGLASTTYGSMSGAALTNSDYGRNELPLTVTEEL